MNRGRTWVVVVAAFATLAGACGGSDSTASPTSSTSATGAPSATVAPASAPAEATGPPTTGVVYPEITQAGSGNGTDPPAPSVIDPDPEAQAAATTANPAGASSETTLPAASPLDDGTYFGYVHAIDAATATIALDTARWLTGAEADQAACDELGECDGASNGYFVVNADLSTVTLRVADGVTATVQGADGRGGDPGDLRSVDLATWSTFLAPGYLSADPEFQYAFAIAFNVTVTGGLVTAIAQQYQP